MITVFTPNPEDLAKGTALNLLFRYGMKTAKKFEVSEYVGNEQNPSFGELKELEGKQWLTSLSLGIGDNQFIFTECLININQEKNIVSTALQGRNGTIKEYISDGDYSISIDAAVNNYQEVNLPNYFGVDIEFVNASMEYPLDKIQQLQRLLAMPQTLELQSDFLLLFGVKSAVVKSFNLQQETHSNRQSISIQMLSDLPYEIYLKQNEDVKTV